MFNPLYIHAGVGLGKTHLLQAIAWAGNRHADRKVLYLTAEHFMYGFVVGAAQRRPRSPSRRRCAASTCWSSTISSSCRASRPRPEFSPHAEFADRRRPPGGDRRRPAAGRPRDASTSACARASPAASWSRWASLGEELRLEILMSRVAAARVHHPDFDVPPPVLAYIARSVTHNGRDLEGALNRLLAHSKLTGQPVTMELAEREIRDLIRPQEPRTGQDRGHPAHRRRATTMSAAATCCRRAAPPMWCARARSPCISPRP